MGLKDVATNTQLFENEKYIRVLRNVCYSYKAPFSFNVLEGGYIYESGEYARETSLVLTLIVVEKAVVNDMEYVMITKKQIRAYFVHETLEPGSEQLQDEN